MKSQHYRINKLRCGLAIMLMRKVCLNDAYKSNSFYNYRNSRRIGLIPKHSLLDYTVLTFQGECKNQIGELSGVSKARISCESLSLTWWRLLRVFIVMTVLLRSGKCRLSNWLLSWVTSSVKTYDIVIRSFLP
jgi:hypothetical protein